MLSMLAAAAATTSPPSLPTFNHSTVSLPIAKPKRARFASSTGFHSPETIPLRKARAPAPVVRVATANADGAVDGSDLEATTGVGDQDEKEKLGVVVKLVEKPRLVLKFVWLEKNIGLALDQVIPGHGTIPLSPYYFWPRKDAWEELKTTLESKPWISQKRMIILLNQATDIINLWQQSGGNL